jgi:hypothetical protein
MLIQIIKIISLIISITGYFIFMKRKINIKDEFIPIILFSIIANLIFIAGILNFMKIITLVIVIIGLGLFIKELIRIIKLKEKIDFKINFSHVYLILMVILFAYLLNGVSLNHYDNFSHWGLIIKSMLVNNRLPNFQDEVIIFTAYPPGTACFVYFMCKFLGKSEGMMLFSQSLLILASVYSIFAFTEKERKSGYLIIVSAIIYFVVGNIYINQLLVDTVLSVLGLAGLSIILYYKYDTKKGLIYSIPIMSLLILVKNSGIFFVIVDLLVWLIYFIKNKEYTYIKTKKYLISILILVIIPCLWKGHINLVYENAENSKHAMSISNYKENLKEKDENSIKIIVQSLFNKISNIQDKDNQVLWNAFALILILGIFSWKNKKLRKSIFQFLLLAILSFIIYQLSVLAMYVFSMPINEAKNLAGYVRYYRTIVMFEYGISVLASLKFINNIEIKNKLLNVAIQIFCIIIILIPVILFKNEAKQLINKNTTIAPIREEIQEIINTNKIESNKSYLIYVSNDENIDTGYLKHICRYEFLSNNVGIIRSFDELENTDNIFDYDYFIMLRKNDETNEFMDIIKGDKENDVVRFR